MIANSLSITIAQRTRELATLRTLGASRRQVRRSIVIEGLVIGAIASVVGIGVGLGLGVGLFKLFDAVGFTLPNNGLVLHTRTVIVALLVGILVTVLASLRPAIARDARAADRGRARGVRAAAGPVREVPAGRLGAARRALGFALLVYGLFGHGLGTKQILLFMGARDAADLPRRRAPRGPLRASARVGLGAPGEQVRRRRRERSPATTRGGTRSGRPRPPRR